MNNKTMRNLIILVFGLALLLGIGYLIMQKVEEWRVKQAKAEIASEVAGEAKGVIGRLIGD